MKYYRLTGLLITASVFTLLIFLSACDDKGTQSSSNGSELPYIHDPWPDERAEILALELSGELQAPRWLYNEIHHDLELISNQWCDSLPFCCQDLSESEWGGCDTLPLLCQYVEVTQFESAYGIEVGFDSANYQAWIGGNFPEFDSLNDYFGMDSSRFLDCYFHCYVDMFFMPRLNLDSIANYYEELPGLYSADHLYEVGIETDLSVGMVNDKRVYTFWIGWEDCENGCGKKHYWEFEIRGNEAMLLQEYGSEVPTGWPPW